MAYIASKVNIGKTKLMKLLYLIDFAVYEQTGKSITNDEYKHWALGPVPMNVWIGMKGNLIEGLLNVAHESRAVGTYIRYTPITNPDVTSFTEEEKRIVDEVIDQYGEMGQEELVDILHKELPYLDYERERNNSLFSGGISQL